MRLKPSTQRPVLLIGLMFLFALGFIVLWLAFSFAIDIAFREWLGSHGSERLRAIFLSSESAEIQRIQVSMGAALIPLFLAVWLFVRRWKKYMKRSSVLRPGQ